MDGRQVKLDLKPCRTCGRTFVPESLAKHVLSCKKLQKPRKVFDASAQRATEDLSVKQIKQAQKKPVKPTKSHWRQQHENFVSTIRNARQTQHAMETGAPLPPPPPPAENPDYVACPCCNRRFNQKAAERHISFCKEKQQRQGGKREPTAAEKSRAAARNYQAPKLGKKAPEPADDWSSGSRGSGGGYSSGVKAAPAARGPPTRAPAGSSGGYGAQSRAPAGTAARGRPAQGRFGR